MQIIVNGDPLEVDAGLALPELLGRIGKAIEHVAVEYNGEVVEREGFAQVMLKEHDQLEIVHFVGGG